VIEDDTALAEFENERSIITADSFTIW